jgi:hypothetical protein
MPWRAIGMSKAWIGVIGTLLGTVIGGALAYILTWDLKRRDDQHKRHALATGLLSEIRLLDSSLRDIHGDATAAYRVMEPFQTALYDQAGANLLLFKPATMHALNVFYDGVHELRTTLARYRLQYPDPHDLTEHYPPRNQEHTWVRIMAGNVIDAVPDAVTRLQKDEGGQWPDKLPPLRVHRAGSQLDVPALKPSIFEDQP